MTALGRIPRFNSIGRAEAANLANALKRPLSGYLGGGKQGGFWIEELSDRWGQAFGCRHAIPCNSATSGLLAACMAAGIDHRSQVWTTPYSMSATAACAKVLGADVRFIDIDIGTLGIDPYALPADGHPRAIIVTNLHGNPAQLTSLRGWAKAHHVIMIEDNAQSPFAMEGDRYAGTIGDMGVFSLNVHKHIQCGEGGVVVTDNDDFADMVRGCINHGELAGGQPGLNLRMTEPVAAIACAQLKKAKGIIEGRRELACTMTEMTKDIEILEPPKDRDGCYSVYYMWCPRMTHGHIYKRERYVNLLNAAGIPIRAGYIKPLHRLFATEDRCPMTEDIEARILSFEICAHDPSKRQLAIMRNIFRRAAERVLGEP